MSPFFINTMFVDISVFNQTNYSDIITFAVDIINWLIGLSAVVAVIMVIAAGFKLIFSMGDEKRIQEASRALLFALVGLVLVFIAPTVINFVLDNLLNGV